jgi:tetratricopeptide (TPR) repeat protein
MAGAAVSLVHDGTEVFRAEGDWTPENRVHAAAVLHYRCLSEGALRLLVTVQGKTVVDHLVNRALPALEQAEAPAAVPAKDVVGTIAFRIAEAEERNHYREALRLYDELLKENPGYTEAYVRKATLQLKMLLTGDAEETLTAALRLTPYSQEVSYYFGLVRLLQGRNQEAKTFLLRVNDTSTLPAASNILLGKLSMREGEYARALQYFETASKRSFDGDTADALSAVCLRKLGRAEKAKKLLEEILAKDPLHPAAAAEADLVEGTLRANTLIRGDAFFALSLASFYDGFGDRESQFAVLTKYTDRRHPLVLYELGRLYAEAGNAEEAAQAFREAEEASPDRVFPSLATTLRALDRAIEAGATRARYYRGLILNSRDRFEEAEAEWSRCAAEGMNYSVAYLNLGTSMLRRGDVEGATAVLEEGLRLPPNNPEIAVTLNSIYKREGRIDKRLALLGDATDAGRLSQLFARMAIGIWNDAGKYREAMDLLTSYRFRSWENEYFPDLSLAKLYRTTRMGLAREAMREARWVDAVRELSQVSVYPDNTGLGVAWNQTFAEERYWMGVCLEKTGDFAGALRRYNEVAGEALDASSPAYEYYVKSMHRKVELEWLGFQ